MIFSFINVNVTNNGSTRDIIFLVVYNNTMQLRVVLGCDSFGKFGFKLIEGSENFDEVTSEILDVEVKSVDVDQTESLKINSEIAVDHQVKW